MGDKGVPRLVSMSAISSRLTWPSLSRSNIWNASLISRTWAGGSFASASPFMPFPPIIIDVDLTMAFTLRVGDVGGSRCGIEAASPRGVQLALSGVGVVAFWSFDGDVVGV